MTTPNKTGARGSGLEARDSGLEAGSTPPPSAPSPQLPDPSLQSPVSSLTERELIARIQSFLPPPPDWLIVGLGDDAAVVRPERNRLEVLSVDALVEGVHFDRRFTPPDAIGHRALAVNLSDLAAMGAAPRLALLSLALPSSLMVEAFDGIARGFTDVARRFGVHVAGGNLTRSPGPLMLDVTVAGTVKPRQMLKRSGARPGDEIFVSGSIGAAAAGLQALQSGNPSAVGDPCVSRYLYPEPRVRAGLQLSRNRAATACIDLSDGLADGLHQIAEASGIGMTIERDALPIEPAARVWFESQGIDPALRAACAGDDYELLFTVRPKLRSRLHNVRRHGEVALTRIGVCTAGSAVILRRTVNGAIDDRPLPPGFSHFR